MATRAFVFANNGVGIPPDMLARVFEMFTQIERNQRLAQGGLGIGLSLGQRLVTMHGGHIEAHSHGEGTGSEFTVVLPLCESPASERRSQLRSALPMAGTAGRRVLVVDDSIDAAESFSISLGAYGHDTRAAFDGYSALSLAREFHPDVVLLDVGMPDMDGCEVCRRLRAEPDGERITILALTGWGQQEDRRRTTEAGFDHHLVKPVDPLLLASLVVEAGAAAAPLH